MRPSPPLLSRNWDAEPVRFAFGLRLRICIDECGRRMGLPGKIAQFRLFSPSISRLHYRAGDCHPLRHEIQWSHRHLGYAAMFVRHAPEFDRLPVPRSRTLASFGARCNRDQRPKRIVNRLRIWKSLGQFRVKEHHIGSLAIPVHVLAPNAAGKVVLRSHLGGTALRGRFLHTCVSHGSSPSGR